MHVTYSLKHKKHGEMNTCTQRAMVDRLTQTVVYMCKLGHDVQTYNGKKRGGKRRGCPEGYSSSEESLSKL